MDEKEEKKVSEEKKETKKEVKKDSNKDAKSAKKETPKKVEVKKEVSKKQTVKKEQPKKEENKKKANKPENKEESVNNEQTQKDYTFRKVENINVKEEKKESFIGKLFKAILIVIIILIVCYCIFVARNFLILDDIQEKASQYANLTNYSYQTKGTTNEYTSDISCSKNNDISRLDISFHLNAGKERSLITYSNKSTKEGISAFPIEKTAIISNSEEMALSEAMFPFQLALQGDYIKWYSLTALIYSEEYNGKDCYVIQDGPDSKKWVEKDTGLVLKVQTGDMITEVVNVEIDTVDEIYKPDLTGYEITEQE